VASKPGQGSVKAWFSAAAAAFFSVLVVGGGLVFQSRLGGGGAALTTVAWCVGGVSVVYLLVFALRIPAALRDRLIAKSNPSSFVMSVFGSQSLRNVANKLQWPEIRLALTVEVGRQGISLWSGTASAPTLIERFAWDDVSAVRVGPAASSNRRYAAVTIVLRSGVSVPLVLTGPGYWGIFTLGRRACERAIRAIDSRRAEFEVGAPTA
jgi:hypothetical protein